jgi:mono/diheme cytochrome c family protein
MGKGSVVFLLALCLVGLIAWGQDTSKPAQAPATAPAATAAAEYKIPPEAAKQANPVKSTPASIAAGKKMYGYDCAMCHGADGDGKGDLAGDMKLQLADLRAPKALQGSTDGELFYIIKNGKGQMPAEGDRVKQEELWNIVNYVRSIAKKEEPVKK